ncbi:MAG: cytochrome c [Proteobacteria bacterium]|nr:cytochrome c [Pseudomonadota bacterium]
MMGRLSGILLLGLAACEPAIDEPAPGAGEEAYSGEELFALACSGCHGADGRGGASGPDLEERTMELTEADVVDIVLFGSGYMDPVRLTEEQALRVAEYVIDSVED